MEGGGIKESAERWEVNIRSWKKDAGGARLLKSR